MEISKVVGTM